jgi:hypothetical protein
MARKGVPGIITVGNREEWPREYWGSKDWEDEEAYVAAQNPKRQERKDAARDRLSQELDNSVVIPPPGPQSAVTTLFPKPRRAGVDARAEAVDKLLEKHGVRPRQRRVSARNKPTAIPSFDLC